MIQPNCIIWWIAVVGSVGVWGQALVPPSGAVTCTEAHDGVRIGHVFTVPVGGCPSLASNLSNLLTACAQNGVQASLNCGRLDDVLNADALRSLRVAVDFSGFPNPITELNVYCDGLIVNVKRAVFAATGQNVSASATLSCSLLGDLIDLNASTCASTANLLTETLYWQEEGLLDGCSVRTAPPTTLSPTRIPTTLPPSVSPTAAPSNAPTVSPTAEPTAAPDTGRPTTTPTGSPTPAPVAVPTSSPSRSPTFAPSTSPTTQAPTVSPSAQPTAQPSTATPSTNPTSTPTAVPTAAPSEAPTGSPTGRPTTTPTTPSPTAAPTPTVTTSTMTMTSTVTTITSSTSTLVEATLQCQSDILGFTIFRLTGGFGACSELAQALDDIIFTQCQLSVPPELMGANGGAPSLGAECFSLHGISTLRFPSGKCNAAASMINSMVESQLATHVLGSRFLVGTVNCTVGGFLELPEASCSATTSVLNNGIALWRQQRIASGCRVRSRCVFPPPVGHSCDDLVANPVCTATASYRNLCIALCENVNFARDQVDCSQTTTISPTLVTAAPAAASNPSSPILNCSTGGPNTPGCGLCNPATDDSFLVCNFVTGQTYASYCHACLCSGQPAHQIDTSGACTFSPTAAPTTSPTAVPSSIPTSSPTANPTVVPTSAPTTSTTTTTTATVTSATTSTTSTTTTVTSTTFTSATSTITTSTYTGQHDVYMNFPSKRLPAVGQNCTALAHTGVVCIAAFRNAILSALSVEGISRITRVGLDSGSIIATITLRSLTEANQLSSMIVSGTFCIVYGNEILCPVGSTTTTTTATLTTTNQCVGILCSTWCLPPCGWDQGFCTLYGTTTADELNPPQGFCSDSPTAAPTSQPTTSAPTNLPTTLAPTLVPTSAAPTTAVPTNAPSTIAPTAAPTPGPSSGAPSTTQPTGVPTSTPSVPPTSIPTTAVPSAVPTLLPSTTPTASPTFSRTTAVIQLLVSPLPTDSTNLALAGLLSEVHNQIIQSVSAFSSFSTVAEVVAQAEYTSTVGGDPTERRMLIRVSARGIQQAICGPCQSVADITAGDEFVLWVNSSVDLAAGRVGLAEARASSLVLFFEVGGLIIRRDPVGLTPGPTFSPTASTPTASTRAPTPRPGSPTAQPIAVTLSPGQTSSTQPVQKSDDNSMMYIIVGAVVGGLLLLILIAIACCRCKSDSRGTFSPEPSQRDRVQPGFASPPSGVAYHGGSPADYGGDVDAQPSVIHPYFQQSPYDIASPAISFEDSPGFTTLAPTPPPPAQTRILTETSLS
eukprot:m.451681 g.451681  ORF g.451681 m.451681 type:complete len:1282 (-) comp20188_c0_seq1:88-3933(-)